jgi:hypothetical protein
MRLPALVCAAALFSIEFDGPTRFRPGRKINVIAFRRIRMTAI